MLATVFVLAHAQTITWNAFGFVIGGGALIMGSCTVAIIVFLYFKSKETL